MKTFVIFRPDGVAAASVRGHTIFEATREIRNVVMGQMPRDGQLLGPLFEGPKLYRFTRVTGTGTTDFLVEEREEHAEETEETT